MNRDLRLARCQSRRRFLRGTAAVGLAAVSAAGLSACARLPFQTSSTRVPTIGFLAPGTREGRAPLVDGLLQGLGELGYVDGQSIHIEYRFAGTGEDRLHALAAELVDLKVDVIVASATLASIAAKQATHTIPVVMGASSEPVASGIVDSLVRPGANVTGMSLMSWQLMGKRLEVLRALIPNLALVAMFANVTNPVYLPQWEALEGAAQMIGIRVQRLDIQRVEDFEPGFKAAAAHQAGALIVPADALITNSRGVIAGLAKQYRQLAIYEFREFVEAGGLMSYGANLAEMYRRAAGYVDKLLKGSRPGDLPIEQPDTFDFAINLTTAREQGITFPESVLLQVTETIQ